MNSDDFEQRLQRQPLREVPPEWRAGILAAAGAPSTVSAKSETDGQAGRGGGRGSRPAVWLHELLWPCPQAWASLVAVWGVILVLNTVTGVPASTAEKQGSAPSPALLAALEEQERFLSEFLGPGDPPLG